MESNLNNVITTATPCESASCSSRYIPEAELDKLKSAYAAEFDHSHRVGLDAYARALIDRWQRGDLAGVTKTISGKTLGETEVIVVEPVPGLHFVVGTMVSGRVFPLKRASRRSASPGYEAATSNSA